MSSLPIANLLNQSIYIAPFQEIADDMGDVIYGEPELRRCRIDFGRSLVYGLDGVNVPSIATIYTNTMVGAKDKLMIPITAEPIPDGDIIGRIDFMQIDIDVFVKIPVEPIPDSDIIGRIDFMQIDIDVFIKSGWAIEGTYLVRIPLEVKTLYDGMGVFSHCEVAV